MIGHGSECDILKVQGMFSTIREQIDTIFREDPAATSYLEILLCYPGLHAVLMHKLTHRLYLAKLRVLARFLSQLARWLTGIEIHPGATIGRRLFIDHGMGVVIGETAVIGDDCLIYQDVTLGGTGKEKGKRHPTIGNNIVVGGGAKVLGNITIGDYSRIGAGSVVIQSVPDHSTVVGIPGRIVRQRGTEPEEKLDYCKMPDPEGQLIAQLTRRIEALEDEIKQMREDSQRVEQR